MTAWFNFYLSALADLVSTVFKLDTGLGFSLGDIEVALLVIGVVASALIIKVQSGVEIEQRNQPVEKSNTGSSSHSMGSSSARSRAAARSGKH